MYLLDTNICIHLLNRADARIEQHFRARSPAEIVLCSVVTAELLYGAHRSTRVDANLQRLRLFFSPLASLPFDDRCVETCAMIPHRPRRPGKADWAERPDDRRDRPDSSSDAGHAQRE